MRRQNKTKAARRVEPMTDYALTRAEENEQAEQAENRRQDEKDEEHRTYRGNAGSAEAHRNPASLAAMEHRKACVRRIELLLEGPPRVDSPAVDEPHSDFLDGAQYPFLHLEKWRPYLPDISGLEWAVLHGLDDHVRRLLALGASHDRCLIFCLAGLARTLGSPFDVRRRAFTGGPEAKDEEAEPPRHNCGPPASYVRLLEVLCDAGCDPTMRIESWQNSCSYLVLQQGHSSGLKTPIDELRRMYLAWRRRSGRVSGPRAGTHVQPTVKLLRQCLRLFERHAGCAPGVKCSLWCWRFSGCSDPDLSRR